MSIPFEQCAFSVNLNPCLKEPFLSDVCQWKGVIVWLMQVVLLHALEFKITVRTVHY